LVKALRKLFPILVFYAANATVTAFLYLWLFALSAKVGDVEYKGETVTFLTLGILAYTFGLRHALDADHLAAIDNSTRKLTQEGKDAKFAGLFFSLGHSTVVILLSLALVVSVRAVETAIPQLENVGNIIGTLISAGFLYIIGLLNFLVFFEIYQIYKEMRREGLDEGGSTRHC